MAEKSEKEIDGLKYEFYPFPASKSVKMFTRILKLLGGSLGGTADLDLSSILNSEVSDLKIGGIVSGLCSRLDEDEILDTIKIFMSKVIHVSEIKDIPGGQVDKIFETHFQGRFDHLIKVFAESVKLEYASFFVGSGGLLREMTAKMTAVSSAKKS